MSFAKMTASALAITAMSATAGVASDEVSVAGSSTVLPYATIVAEAFKDNFGIPVVVASGGSSAGLKQFCTGVGPNTIDIANASRQIRSGEVEACAAAGVTEIMEVRIGYDGIVFASQVEGPEFTAFTEDQWYKALAAEHIVDGELVPNEMTKWSEVDASLPDVEISAYIPGTKHGTREVFEEKVLLVGCEHSGALQAMLDSGVDEDTAEGKCMAVRTDGASVDIDGDYTETLNRIDANPNGVGVFGLAFYENNTATLKVATMSGVSPSTETISSGEYPVSRPLFFYVKKAHMGETPGLQEYVEFFVSDAVAGPNGPLAQYGLVSDPELAATQEAVASQVTMGSGS